MKKKKKKKTIKALFQPDHRWAKMRNDFSRSEIKPPFVL